MKRMFSRIMLSATCICVSCAFALDSDRYHKDFERLMKREYEIERLKEVYKKVAQKGLATVEDKEIIAARKEVYRAVKKAFTKLQEKFAMTAEERSNLQELSDALAKQHNFGSLALSDEEIIMIEAAHEMLFELLQEQGDSLKKAIQQEVELFKVS